jgi:hypothetical protein
MRLILITTIDINNPIIKKSGPLYGIISKDITTRSPFELQSLFGLYSSFRLYSSFSIPILLPSSYYLKLVLSQARTNPVSLHILCYSTASTIPQLVLFLSLIFPYYSMARTILQPVLFSNASIPVPFPAHTIPPI